MAERTRTASNRLAAIPNTVAIPGGRFAMGSDRGRPDEQPVHLAEVEPFRMAVTPVTVSQFAEFLAAGPASPPPWWDDPDFSAPEQPVVGMSWFDAVAYTTWLAAVSRDRWRLPTEAEWEWAALGGHEGAPTAWGAALPANEVPEGHLRGPWHVGKGTPNPYGLYDVGTIVHEWCLDVYRPYGAVANADAEDEAGFSTKPRAKPRGSLELFGAPFGSRLELRRSSRGGSWRHRQRWSSPSARSSLPPDFRYADYGFRVLREI